MSDPEKWAWWTLGVVVLTIAAYAVFLAFLGHGPRIDGVFSLLALTALPAFRGRPFTSRTFDERECNIAHKALLTAFRAFWLLFVALIVGIGHTQGWHATLTVPVWILLEVLWWAATLVLGVQALTTILLYRRGSHA
jgi:hypothetical protein